MMTILRNKDLLGSLLLRIGLAFSFLYAAIAAYFDPFSWIGFFPSFAHTLIPNDALLLGLFGCVETLVALWLLSGWRIFLPSIAAALLLFGIVIFNWGALDILFRDVSLGFMALALAVQNYPMQSPTDNTRQ